MCRNITLAREAIKFGANVNEKDKKGVAPLHYASIAKKAETIEFYLEHGARLIAVDDAERTPACHVAESLDKSTGVEAMRQTLTLVAPLGRSDLWDREYDAYAAKGVHSTTAFKRYQTVWSMAMHNHHRPLCKVLREISAGLPKQVSPLLRIAIEDNDADLVQLLVVKGVLLDDGEDLLHEH